METHEEQHEEVVTNDDSPESVPSPGVPAPDTTPPASEPAPEPESEPGPEAEPEEDDNERENSE